MIDQSVTHVSPAKATRHIPQTTQCTALIVGGTRIFRLALKQWLMGNHVDVPAVMGRECDLAEWLAANPEAKCNVVIQIAGSGPFAAFRRIHDILAGDSRSVPLAVLAEQATRGQVYAALRIGAKAFVNLDAEPEELLKAITMAASNKVYLASDAAEVLINDVSVAVDDPSASPRLAQVTLSRREVEIVQLLCEGLSSKEIARSLHISSKTVDNHRYNIYRKCDTESLAGLMRYAIHHGLISV